MGNMSSSNAPTDTNSSGAGNNDPPENSDENRSQSEADVGPNAPRQYWCHQCQVTLDHIGENFSCPNCNGGFLEEIQLPSYARNARRNRHYNQFGGQGFNVNEGGQVTAMSLDEFFQRFAFPMMFGNRPGSSQAAGGVAQGATAGSGAVGGGGPSIPGGTPGGIPNTFEGFMQNLLQNLSNNGAFQIQFQMGQEGAPGFQLHGNLGDYAWGPNALDAIVTQLLNQMEGGAPPMNQDRARNLPKVKITEKDVEQRRQCTICFDDYTLDQEVVQLQCKHVFHESCIQPWLERHNSCPICRKPADETSDGSSSEPQQTTSASTAAAAASGTSSQTRSSSQPRTNAPPTQNLDPMDEYD